MHFLNLPVRYSVSDISVKWLFIIDSGIRWIKHCLVNLMQGMWITLNPRADYAEIYENM
jgi:hypothetical protein